MPARHQRNVPSVYLQAARKAVGRQRQPADAQRNLQGRALVRIASGREGWRGPSERLRARCRWR
eukprot:4078791-Alexandrium_andersonii.AAC.1